MVWGHHSQHYFGAGGDSFSIWGNTPSYWDLDRVPLSEKAPIFNENPPIVGRPQDSGTRRTLYGNYGGANYHKHNPHKLHDLPVLKRVADRVLETAKKTVVGGGRMELHHP